MLIETIKNVVYFGLGLLAASFAFMYSDDIGVFDFLLPVSLIRLCDDFLEMC